MSAALTAQAAIPFGGFSWEPREGVGAPGPNTWIKSNVIRDKDGLHFWLRPSATIKWTGSQATASPKVHFGTLVITIRADFDKIDDKAVFSPFLYPTPDVGPDGTNEIDIVEFSRWGTPGAPLLNLVQWPQTKGSKPQHTLARLPKGTREVTVTLTWTPTSVTLETDLGVVMKVTDPQYVPQKPMDLVFNIRYVKGEPANPNAEPLEVIITSLKYTPYKAY